MAPVFACELTVTLFFTHLDYLHPLYNRGALEQETSSHHTLTTMCKLFTKVERLIIWKIHINKAIQLPELSDSEVFSVQSLRLSRQMYLFPLRLLYSAVTKQQIYALTPNLILNPYTLHRG